MILNPKNNILYFDEKLHKYTDNLGNPYTSTTTIISKYINEFNSDKVATACERIGRTPTHPKYLKYRGKTKDMILADWNKEKVRALENGTKKHDFLEKAIKQSTGYNFYADSTYINGRIYTIDDVLKDPKYGRLDQQWFVDTGIANRYPIIYEHICILMKAGFLFYAEIGVFDVESLSSGLIDLLAIRIPDFIIIDWKTNKDPIRYDSGYFEKDLNNNTTDVFIPTNKFMKPPIHHLADSVGNHYALQLSSYAWHCMNRGLNCLGALLYQIRETESKVEYTEKLVVPLLLHEAEAMTYHHASSIVKKQQTKLFI